MNKDLNKKLGFTLPEVLITLGIIGIVSAMTIPTLIKNYQTKVRDNQFKKVYATLTQSLNMTLAEYDYIPICYYPSGAGNSKVSECPTFWQKFASKLKVAKYCQNNSFAQGCIPHYDGIEIVFKENHKNDADYDEEYWENYSNNMKGFRTDDMKTKAQAYVLSDGSIIIIYVVYNSPCALFLVDVNGFSAPNKWSHDLHLFGFEYDGSNQRFRVVARGMETYQGGISTNSLFKKLFGTSF